MTESTNSTQPTSPTDSIDPTESPDPTQPTQPTDPTDGAALRRLAAERLMRLAHLQGRRRHRGPNRQPWHDPHQGQGRILALLKMKDEMPQPELTFLSGLTRQALAELLAKLERQGLIERSPSPTDRRVMVVRLTDAGRATEQQLTDPAPGDGLFDALTNDEVARLCDYLGRSIAALEQARGQADDHYQARMEERRAALEEVLTQHGIDPQYWPDFMRVGRGGRGFGRGRRHGQADSDGRGRRRGPVSWESPDDKAAPDDGDYR
ncbi:MAG: MarR family winged helix-turn-helix transcriptional regulator [Propionibacteriaceae bacterium]|nr:MarR family winged helix-turn-helix transcriptional regulator [Propionibacteriaceae bacterium]